MFLSIFQSLTGLIFTGTFLYAILMSKRLTRAVRTQQIMVGAAFGILAASLASQGLSMQPLHAELDIKAGPLIFAGYLGGPIGALVAAAMWTLFRILFDGQATGFSPNLALVFPKHRPYRPISGAFKKPKCDTKPCHRLYCTRLCYISNWPCCCTSFYLQPRK
jgi:hypothetical protein